MLGVKGKTADWENMPLPKMLRGNSLDAYFTMKIFKKLSKNIDSLKMDKVYKELISPAVHMFNSMEMDGIFISRERLSSIGSTLSSKILDIEDSLYSYKEVPKGKEVKMSSTHDLIEILFSCDPEKNIIPGVGFNLFPPITSEETGAPSTNVECLEIILDQIEDELNRRKESGVK